MKLTTRRIGYFYVTCGNLPCVLLRPAGATSNRQAAMVVCRPGETPTIFPIRERESSALARSRANTAIRRTLLLASQLRGTVVDDCLFAQRVLNAKSPWKIIPVRWERKVSYELPSMKPLPSAVT